MAAHGKSSDSVEIKFVDPDVVRSAVYEYVSGLKQRDDAVLRVYWFGSWTKSTYSPGSDVDLCIIVARSDKLPRDRCVDYLPTRFPVGVDLFVYTDSEFERLADDHPEWRREIVSGIVL